MNETAMGQIAYEAYAKHTDWKSLVSGQQLPSWDVLDSKIREAWAVAASAMMNAHAGYGAHLRIGLVNCSTLLSDADVQKMAAAIDAQLNEDYLPAWHRAPSSCLFVPGGAHFTSDPDVLALKLLDSADEQGALGYHTEAADGTIWGEIGIKDVLDSGGGVLTAGSSGDSVSAVVSHEALEAKGDPNANLWIDGPATFDGKSWAEIAAEDCDPCQAGAYLKNGVLVSEFVLPAWRDPENKRGPWSNLGSCPAPLSVAPGGYAVVRDAPGSEQQVFGAGGNARPWRRGIRRHMRLPVLR